MAVRFSLRLAGWLLLSVVACSDRSPTEPSLAAAPGGVDLETATAGRPRRPAPRVLTPRASDLLQVHGAWGGDHVGLTITNDAVAIEFDCAGGSIHGPFLTDSAGRFALDGSWWFTPPVLPEGWQPEKHPARYSGVVEDGIMTLTVYRLDDGQFLGIFHLAFNQPPRIVRCV